jgi:hypothetical protein
MYQFLCFCFMLFERFCAGLLVAEILWIKIFGF